MTMAASIIPLGTKVTLFELTSQHYAIYASIIWHTNIRDYNIPTVDRVLIAKMKIYSAPCTQILSWSTSTIDLIGGGHMRSRSLHGASDHTGC